MASGIAINVTLPNAATFGGVAPIVIYEAKSDSVVTISGLGRWPRAASIDYFNRHAGGEIPLGILRCVTPGAPDAWLTALERYGTMTFEQVVTPALELAGKGFPISATVQSIMGTSDETALGSLGMWPSTADVFMPKGRRPEVGEPVVQSDLARTFKRMIEAERGGASGGREAGIRAARDLFYKGEIAEEMARFSQEQGGLLTLDDLKEFSVKVEPPEVGRFREYEVYTCGPWCQGPVVAQTLQMLAEDDLAGLGHNSADYAHLVSQALNLSFADRHRYYGDPDHVDVPMAGLLSAGYTRERRQAVDMARAFGEMPEAGNPVALPGQAGQGRRAHGPAGGGAGPDGAGHELHLRRRPLGQCLLGDAERRHRRRSDRSGPRLPDLFEGEPELAGPGAGVQPPAVEAPEAHPEPIHHIEERQAVHALRDAGRRRAVLGDGAAVPECRRARDEPAACHRAAQVHPVELPQLLLAAHLPARQADRGGQSAGTIRWLGWPPGGTTWRCWTTGRRPRGRCRR